MTIIEMNTGTKIDYEVSGNKICFDDDLTLNLAKREEDDPVHIDICYDADKTLVIGTAAGRSYVAQIDIPARQYTETTSEVTTATEESSDDESSEITYETITREPVDFDIDNITLSLWAI